MFLLGFLLGSATTWGMAYWLYRGMRSDERWWQGSEHRRNFYWPVLPGAHVVHDVSAAPDRLPPSAAIRPDEDAAVDQ